MYEKNDIFSIFSHFKKGKHLTQIYRVYIKKVRINVLGVELESQVKIPT